MALLADLKATKLKLSLGLFLLSNEYTGGLSQVKNTFFIIIFLLSNQAISGTSISKKYAFPVEKLEILESFLKDVSNRPDKERPRFYHLGDGIVTECPPQKPTQDLRGCKLLFKFEFSGGAYFTIDKELYLGGVVAVVKTKTSQTDPNSTGELNFGNLFSNDTSSSNYFCEPIVEDDRRVWRCNLFLSEGITR
jgi:hypothetical protein